MSDKFKKQPDIDITEAETGRKRNRSELIRRRDAIDAIEGLPNLYNGFSDSYDKAYIIWVLEELPSAEPVIRCKDCKHYNAGYECLIEGYGIERDKDWFCGDAERKEDE